MSSIIEAIKEKDLFAKHNKIELIAVKDGWAKSQLSIDPAIHLNAAGIIHGGALFSLADFTFGAASNSRGRVALGISANIFFIKAVSSGTIYAEAKEISLNFKLATYDIAITDKNGEILATFNGTVYRKKDEIFI